MINIEYVLEITANRKKFLSIKWLVMHDQELICDCYLYRPWIRPKRRFIQLRDNKSDVEISSYSNHITYLHSRNRTENSVSIKKSTVTYLKTKVYYIHDSKQKIAHCWSHLVESSIARNKKISIVFVYPWKSIEINDFNCNSSNTHLIIKHKEHNLIQQPVFISLRKSNSNDFIC